MSVTTPSGCRRVLVDEVRKVSLRIKHMHALTFLCLMDRCIHGIDYALVPTAVSAYQSAHRERLTTKLCGNRMFSARND